MTAYAIARLGERTGSTDEVADYMEQIQATMDPYGGRFLVHGVQHEVIEGSWPGAVVIVEFPDLPAARDWYGSAAYQKIIPLRTRNIDGDIVFVEGVAPGYDASGTAARLRESAAQG